MFALSSARLHLALLLITVVSVVTTVAVWAENRGEEATREVVSPSNDMLSAFAVQLDARTEGIVIVNHDKSTLCLYKYVQVNEQQQLALVAVRDFSNDFELDDYNNAPPRPADIKQILEKHSALPKP